MHYYFGSMLCVLEKNVSKNEVIWCIIEATLFIHAYVYSDFVKYMFRKCIIWAFIILIISVLHEIT